MYRAFLAFIQFQGGDAAAEFYADAAQTTELIQEGFLMISILIGDSLIVRRFLIRYEDITRCSILADPPPVGGLGAPYRGRGVPDLQPRGADQ